MSEVRIAAEPRTEFGKGAARRTRRAHRVPAVLYGHGTDPQHVSLPDHELMMALKTSNVLLVLTGLGNDEQLVLPKAVQRDAVRGHIEHVDLLIVRKGERVMVDVPLITVGQILPDGMLDHDLIQLSVWCEATNIPVSLEVNVEGLRVGDAIHTKDIVLPAGLELAADPELLVVNVLAAPTAQQVEASVGGEAPETSLLGEPAAGA